MVQGVWTISWTISWTGPNGGSNDPISLIMLGVFLVAMGERIFFPLIFQIIQLLLQQPR